MEGGESPLEVLSRAATMIQETQQQQNMTFTELVNRKRSRRRSTLSSPIGDQRSRFRSFQRPSESRPICFSCEGRRLRCFDDTNKQNATKQLPTTKWKRDRRTRAEYQRKSDPKVPDNFPEQGPDSPENGPQNGGSSNGFGKQNDAPLDMSVRQRGLPPSYSQAISDPSFRSSYRQSVISSPRDEIPTGISMCDPIIDEHFRRSLGKDYNTVFSNNNVPKETSPPPKPPPKMTTNNVIELMDSTGLSVDEHFAKALGDTWLKLNNKKDPELKSNGAEGHGVVTI